jgi:cellulose synthase/poly-beta-1,6-N-acetylglucosamine synthase-like glycosyltransferase
MLFPWPALLDCRNLAARLRKPIKPSSRSLGDYTIVVPAFGSPAYLSNVDFLLRNRDRVLIATTDREGPEMEEHLSKLEREGIRVARLRVEERADVKFSLLRQVAIYDLLRREAARLVGTKYLVFMDGDSVPEGDLGRVCAALDEAGLNLASVKVVPSASSNLVERMQKVEYGISMLARHYMPWLTSGACIVGRTEDLRKVMAVHSLYFWGGDIEVGMLAKDMGMRVGHVDFRVYTEVPRSFRAWFRQRVNWFCGWFRTVVVNVDRHLRRPIYLAYSLDVLLTWPLKLWLLFLYPWTLPLVVALYIPLTFLVNWQVRCRDMLLFPLYALFQVLVMPPLGALRYLQVLVRRKATGRMKL